MELLEPLDIVPILSKVGGARSVIVRAVIQYMEVVVVLVQVQVQVEVGDTLVQDQVEVEVDAVLMIVHLIQNTFTMLPWLKKIHGKVCHLLHGKLYHLLSGRS